MIQSPNSLVPRDFPSGMKRARSFVASPFENAFSIAAVIRSAASFHPIYSSIITDESKSDDGLTTFFPAMLGAVPCVASKMA